MALKIFHTSDLHIGMKYGRYPDGIREELANARIDVLNKLVDIANDEECNLFVVAGDLFETVRVDKIYIDRVIKSLNAFAGECIAVIPGNHDYDNGMIDLWTSFKHHIPERILYVDKEKPYNLDAYHLNAVIYPAPCHSRHSEENNISWLKKENFGSNLYN